MEKKKENYVVMLIHIFGGGGIIEKKIIQVQIKKKAVNRKTGVAQMKQSERPSEFSVDSSTEKLRKKN